MKYRIHAHRFADRIIDGTPELRALWDEIDGAIVSLTDERLISQYYERDTVIPLDEQLGYGNSMSISKAINNLLKLELEIQGWTSESALFQEEEYSDKRWRLDFSKSLDSTDSEAAESGLNRYGMAVEVAFNHGEAIAWNLLKPVLAGELNHVEQQTEIGAGVGIIICATAALKEAGAFDGAVGEYEKFLRYLKPMRNQLTIPMMIVGLEAPESFRIVKAKDSVTRKTRGQVIRF